MTTPKVIRVIKYFSLLTLLVGAIFVTLTYFSPSLVVTKSIGVYIPVFIASAIILLVTAVAKAIFLKSHRREFFNAIAWLLLNVGIAFIYLQIFSFSLDTMLVKIINNTGDVVKDVRCFDQQWPRLLNGESKTVRLNSRYMIHHSVTYKLEGKERMVVLPKAGGVKFTCLLGKKPRTAGL
ncbi:MAG: hypothetical protein ICV66_12430 [Chitinophagaceae bacterium]|nr:hypothetical protein [Chitinophagaceae bacterium]